MANVHEREVERIPGFSGPHLLQTLSPLLDRKQYTRAGGDEQKTRENGHTVIHGSRREFVVMQEGGREAKNPANLKCEIAMKLEFEVAYFHPIRHLSTPTPYAHARVGVVWVRCHSMTGRFMLRTHLA